MRKKTTIIWIRATNYSFPAVFAVRLEAPCSKCNKDVISFRTAWPAFPVINLKSALKMAKINLEHDKTSICLSCRGAINSWG